MNEPLQRALLEELQGAPEGLAEYDLLKAMRQRELLPPMSHGDNLALFRSHFRLFNALYQLRDRLHGEGRHQLQISPLRIVLLPWLPGCEATVPTDPLRDYYLDESQLEATGTDEVEQLLESFWRRFDAAPEREAALRELQLEVDPPPDLASIRRRYRQLAARHHPDRGGDAQRMQMLNRAMEILLRYYR